MMIASYDGVSYSRPWPGPDRDGAAGERGPIDDDRGRCWWAVGPGFGGVPPPHDDGRQPGGRQSGSLACWRLVGPTPPRAAPASGGPARCGPSKFAADVPGRPARPGDPLDRPAAPEIRPDHLPSLDR